MDNNSKMIIYTTEGGLVINDKLIMYRRTCGQKSGLERSNYVFEKTKRRSYKAIY